MTFSIVEYRVQRRRIGPSRHFRLVLCLVALPLPALAQSGGITGTVTDHTGGVLPGATVEVAGPPLAGAPRLEVTDTEGRYAFSGLPAGTYTVSFTLPGFLSASRDGVELAVGATATIDAVLQIGSLFEEVTVAVTGTAFDEPPINLPYAVAVVDREELEELGSLPVTDFFKNLGASSAVIGEANSWYNDQALSVPETVANVNLRGLGASRTLVLFNGRRQTPVPARLFGGRFVDVNVFPAIALDRIEVLKEGAAAIYGSDAVAGVANFVTRDDFEGLEVSASHDDFDGAGDTTFGAIWGGKIGPAHAVVSVERVDRQELDLIERDWAVRARSETFWGWSSTGNPGAFLTPSLAGADLVSTLAGARDAGDFFIDPACEELGGALLSDTCAFRYQIWDTLIEEQEHTRAFFELNGPMDDRTTYHLEALWADARVPDYLTTPSFPPVSLFDGLQVVEPDNPGRQAFCGSDYGAAGFASADDCLASDDWYFYGRLIGNSGPGRTLSRKSRTGRLAASVARDLRFGERDASLDVGVSYSRAAGNMNQPAEYAYRKFLAFRGYGGPTCGVGVVADARSPSGLALGSVGDRVAGQGDCMYYNPFSNALQFSAQPGAAYEHTANPAFDPALANSAALRDWINEEVNLKSTAGLLVSDATLSGTLIEDVASYAVGYQFRRFDVSATPNDAANLSLNPCLAPGDRSCIDARGRFTGSVVGPFTFTPGFHPYAASQTVHRVFGEIPLNIGPRLDAQLAANYEIHDTVSSFDPKAAATMQIMESANYALSLRGSVQSTFRAPSVDDLNEDVRTTLEWFDTVGAYKAVDAYGNRNLVPEEALTWNVGLVLFATPGIEMTFDYWTYDFSEVIAPLPYDNVVQLYIDATGDDSGLSRDERQRRLNAVQHRVFCPGGATDGSCIPANIERVRVDLTNWPGVETSGLDWRVGARFDAGPGRFSATLDTTMLLEYRLRALEVDGVRFTEAQDVAGAFNREIPVAPPLPKMKTRASVGYHWNDISLLSWVNHISSYEDRYVWTRTPFIEPFLTWDANFLWRLDNGVTVTFSALNLTDEAPPRVDYEQGFDGLTHNPKSRRLKIGLTYRFGARRNGGDNEGAADLDAGRPGDAAARR